MKQPPLGFFVRLTSIALRRIEPALNVARFYELAVERDLFGRVVLVRRWGRIGMNGRHRLDEYRSEAEAVLALHVLASKKVRRGYRRHEAAHLHTSRA